jgi:hypothetical protein
MSIFEKWSGTFVFSLFGRAENGNCEHTGKATKIVILKYAVKYIGRNHASLPLFFWSVQIKSGVFPEKTRSSLPGIFVFITTCCFFLAYHVVIIIVFSLVPHTYAAKLPLKCPEKSGKIKLGRALLPPFY